MATRYKIIHEGVYGVENVKLYGAKGNGSTNDDAAIAAAIATCASKAAYATLYFPAGRYCFTSASGLAALTSIPNLTICGDGIGSTYLKNTENNALSLHVPYTASNFVLRDLTIECTTDARTSGQHAVLIGEDSAYVLGNRMNGATIKNVAIVNGSEFSLYLSQIDGLVVDNVKIVNGWADGIHLSLCYNVAMANLFVDTSDDDCLAIETCHNLSAVGGSLMADATKGTSWGRGIAIFGACRDITVSDFNVSTIKQDGCYVFNDSTNRPTRIKVANCDFYNTSTSSTNGGSITITGCDDLDLIGNTVRNPATGNGIAVHSGNRITINGCSVTQTINQYCRGIFLGVDDNSTDTIVDCAVVNNVINLTGASTNGAIVVKKSDAVTDPYFTGISITGNTGVVQSGERFVFTRNTVAGGRVYNNTTLAGTPYFHDTGGGGSTPAYGNNN